MDLNKKIIKTVNLVEYKEKYILKNSTHTHVRARARARSLSNSPRICSFLALSKHSCCGCNLLRGFRHYSSSNNLAADVGRMVWREQKAQCSLCVEGGHRELATQDTECSSMESM